MLSAYSCDRYNELKSVPSGSFDVKSLTELTLAGNQITSIPPRISQLQNLTALHLDGICCVISLKIVTYTLLD